MKKLCLFIVLSMCLSTGYSQQVFFEAFSGYNVTAYSPKAYPKVGYVPLGFRVAGGLEHVQIGAEYRQNITNPEFTDDMTMTKEEFEETYYGGFLRVNLSSLPAYRFGLVFKGGAGYYNMKRNLYSLPGNELQAGDTFEYEKKLGYNVGVGISAPIWTLIHWEIGYQFNGVERDDVAIREGYKAHYHSIQAGLSLNLVFGNVAKKCRRVITSYR